MHKPKPVELELIDISDDENKLDVRVMNNLRIEYLSVLNNDVIEICKALNKEKNIIKVALNKNNRKYLKGSVRRISQIDNDSIRDWFIEKGYHIYEIKQEKTTITLKIKKLVMI